MVKDVQLDSAEVRLEKQFYCFSCKTLMRKMATGDFMCPRCGETCSE